jgi:cell division septal protein FtsQ
MKKQKRLKKIKLPNVIEDAKRFVFSGLVNGGVILIFLVVVLLLFRAFIHGSNYFDLRHVDTKGIQDRALSRSIGSEILKNNRGKNVFDINIQAIAKYLAFKYQDAKDVSVVRSLPDKLTIIFRFRVPVALLADGKNYPVDREGYIVLNVDEKAVKDLPVISGIESRYEERIGRKNASKNLISALELLKEIRGARFMSKHRLIRIDARDVKGLAFFIDDGLEVRIGNENLKERLSVLRKTLGDPRVIVSRIRYIDLRFEDVVIGPK